MASRGTRVVSFATSTLPSPTPNINLNSSQPANWTLSGSPRPPAMPSMPLHAPYPLPMANLGGLPIKSIDDPITAVFLFLFVLGAVAHMTILITNLKRGHKFIISGLLFGFCMARITTCTMRLVFASYPRNVSIAIAAQIFVAAGVLLLFIINLIFTQRVVRATHPHWAWSKPFSVIFKVYYVSIVLMLIALIFCTVQGFYTLDTNIRRIDRDVQLVGSTYFAVAAFLPIPLLALNFLIPRKYKPSAPRVEKFGSGRFRTKIWILVVTSALLTFGAAFRAGIAYVPRPKTDPAWYHDKACFYIVNFTVEIIVIAIFAAVRVDRRFHVPDGSRRPGDYLRRNDGSVDGDLDRRLSRNSDGGSMTRIGNEEEVFGDGGFVVVEKTSSRRSKGSTRSRRSRHSIPGKDVEMETGKDNVDAGQRPSTELLEKPPAPRIPGNSPRLSESSTLTANEAARLQCDYETEIQNRS
ncbi:hypothetical protein ONS95_014519 [Cadophora gregata]|uniref:uncharacterized protein n=1 Tax=Cadophora gregata TaxID=51156 RepID=UPI0026DCD679|nr:uncharacterized protein ONS95_014519 [Cadophora gregata]KAK0112786.1 hypothetical protein ONS95_014519 [Cadophora gregata]KAK0124961.1 hypothetical protein ONS96_008831 [Cadophora gregata f. sp. sojae]